MSPIIRLKRWFIQSKRDLPWREASTPYAVWVSEVMLQQTQVAVVVPYFLRWMERFPSIAALAAAPLESVIKTWEGLGYYSRARNLHAGAQYVVAHHGGTLPSTYEELNQIKGLGPYTIGAILSFAFHQRIPAVDGNVLRVLTRFWGMHEDISKGTTQKKIRERVFEWLPDAEPWVINEALIELGAMICQKQPKCTHCPLQADCVAFKKGLTQQLPYKSSKTDYEKLYRTVAVVMHGNAVLLQKQTHLYEFPYFETFLESAELAQQISTSLKLPVTVGMGLEEVTHCFTKYRVRLKSFMCTAHTRKSIEGFQWHPVEELSDLAFSSGHRRVLASANFKYL